MVEDTVYILNYNDDCIAESVEPVVVSKIEIIPGYDAPEVRYIVTAYDEHNVDYQLYYREKDFGEIIFVSKEVAEEHCKEQQNRFSQIL